jgi:hypothetical protein
MEVKLVARFAEDPLDVSREIAERVTRGAPSATSGVDGIFPVERDSQPEDISGAAGDAAVAQVQPEEIDVGGREPLEPVSAGAAASAG